MRHHRSSYPTYATVPDAVRYLASACDGARSRDGHGFGAEHVVIGHWLAEEPDHIWSRLHLSIGRTLVGVYRRQLEGAGFDPDAILRNARPRRQRNRGRSMAAGWAFDPTGRAAYRWWNGARWTAHVASVEPSQPPAPWAQLESARPAARTLVGRTPSH